MKITAAEFLTSSPDYESCPAPTHPEFAFIGRSNVGKSSLLNMLTRKKNLATVSQKPGATRMINFFTINNKMNFVDLPGYGYAKVAKSERRLFLEFIEDYLSNRQGLRCIIVLINAQHSPQTSDLEFCAWLASNGKPFVIAFTKTDKLKKSKTHANSEAFLNALANYTEGTPRTFFTSAKNEDGRRELLLFIDQALKA